MKTENTKGEPKQIDEKIFGRWCKKHITELLQPYAGNQFYEDLYSDCQLKAYRALRSCQVKQIGVNYNEIIKGLTELIPREIKNYTSGGISDSNNTEIELEDDVEDKAYNDPIYESGRTWHKTQIYEKWLKYG